MADPVNLYWDSCVFVRYLTRTPDTCLADIDQYVSEAKDKRVAIHFSTIVFTEIRTKFLKSRFGSVADFISDLGSSFLPFDPNPNILSEAGALRDHEPVNPSDPNIEPNKKRTIGTGDAIHLATCLYLRDVAGVRDIVFHTFDEGKGVTWEGRCVPLIGFEKWYPPAHRVNQIADVVSLRRTLPIHPHPDLSTMAARDASINPNPSNSIQSAK